MYFFSNAKVVIFLQSAKKTQKIIVFHYTSVYFFINCFILMGKLHTFAFTNKKTIIMKIGIIVAMDKEHAQLSNLLATRHEENYMGNAMTIGMIGPHEIILQKCGIGKVNAAMGTIEMVVHQLLWK